DGIDAAAIKSPSKGRVLSPICAICHVFVGSNTLTPRNEYAYVTRKMDKHMRINETTPTSQRKPLPSLRKILDLTMPAASSATIPNILGVATHMRPAAHSKKPEENVTSCVLNNAELNTTAKYASEPIMMLPTRNVTRSLTKP